MVRQLHDEFGYRSRGSDITAVPVDLVGIGELQPIERAFDVVEERPHRPTVPRHVLLGGFDVEVPQSVVGEAELVDHRSRAEDRVVTVADVHAGAVEGIHRGGAPTDGRSCLDDDRR